MNTSPCLPKHLTGSELRYHRTLCLLLQLEEACMGQQGQRSFCFVRLAKMNCVSVLLPLAVVSAEGSLTVSTLTNAT